jgi:dihydrolipoamide dehydrogenase
MKVDVTVIGGGPGGYVAAIRCAQLGMKVALVEKHERLGGTCTNVGCIPSKALLDSSERYHEARTHFAAHGIGLDNLRVDWTAMRARKDKVVQLTALGIDKLMEKNGITRLRGVGRFLSPVRVAVDAAAGAAGADGGTTEIETDKVIIATGSKPFDLPFCRIDKERVISSTEALALPEIPRKLVVIGAGVIGLELGSVFARLGTQVTVVEALERCIPGMDAELGKELERSLKKLGFTFHLGAKVSQVEAGPEGVVVRATSAKGKELELAADRCLVAIGRKPNTSGLALEAAGLEADGRGFIPVDAHLETKVPGIFAIGDVIGGAMLAHKAEEEGVFVAELLAGQQPHLDHNLIPGVVYTWPEVAAVGSSEDELKASGRAYKKGSFPFIALGRARAAGEKEGFVKILADAATDEVLGVQMIGPRAADLIAEAVLAMEYKASAEDIARVCHAHPTYAEAVKEAALAATDNRALHL